MIPNLNAIIKTTLLRFDEKEQYVFFCKREMYNDTEKEILEDFKAL